MLIKHPLHVRRLGEHGGEKVRIQPDGGNSGRAVEKGGTWTPGAAGAGSVEEAAFERGFE